MNLKVISRWSDCRRTGRLAARGPISRLERECFSLMTVARRVPNSTAWAGQHARRPARRTKKYRCRPAKGDPDNNLNPDEIEPPKFPAARTPRAARRVWPFSCRGSLDQVDCATL